MRVARPLTLVVVSYPERMEAVFEASAQHFAKATGPDFALERCQDPDDVVFLARRWKHRGRRIIRLDLHGHGDGGRFKLGDRVMFASDGTGYRLARELAGKLAANAELRLLGCNVANERHPRDPLKFSGGKLLRDLQVIVGRRRRVLASADYLGPQQWSATGLTPSAELLLRSSLALRASSPPRASGHPRG